MPEDDPDAFDNFTNWLYRDQLPIFPVETFLTAMKAPKNA